MLVAVAPPELSIDSFYSVHLTLVVALFQCFALVIFVLAACETDDQLCQPFFIYEQAGGHNGESRVLYHLLQLAQFLAFKEQLAIAPRRVVVVRAIKILGYVHILNP